MIRSAALLAIAGLALAACGGHDKAGGARVGGTQRIEVAIRDGSPRLLTAYAAAVARIARAQTRVVARKNWRAEEPDPEGQTIADVRRGRVDFALVSARAFDTLGVNGFAPMVAPLAIDSLEAQRRVLESDLPRRALATVSRAGVVGVAVLPGDLRHPLGLARPLVRPEDYAGAFVGVRASRMSKQTFEHLGASVVFTTGDDFAGLDGIEIDLIAAESTRADVGAKSLAADLTLWPRVLVLVANPKAWKRVDEARRDALRKGGRASLAAAIASLRADDADAYAVLCRRGRVSFARTTRADAEAMRRALAPVTRGLDPAVVEQIARLRDAAGPPPVHPRCRPPARAHAGKATPIDGVWTFDSDEADLRAVHAPAAELTPENWGHHVFAFSRGRFAITQQNAESCTWVYGRYSVRDHRMTWDVTDGGGYGPQDATNRPGEHFLYDWSRFKDTLDVSPVRGATSARNFISKPWRRIGSDPRRAPLSRRCPPPPTGLQF